MSSLKLIALDAEDLAVISAHLQDAVIRVADMAYLKAESRFAAVANRFDWHGAQASGGPPRANTEFQRRRTGLRFERVRSARLHGIDLSDADRCLNMLAISFQPTGGESGPEGFIVFDFSGGAAIKLEVECVEGELKDLGAAWTTPHRPDHGSSEPQSSG